MRERKAALGSMLIGILGSLLLVWYVVLGLHTEFAFWEHYPLPGSLMADFNVNMDAFARAIHGVDPYAIRQMGEAYLYPLPGLLLNAILSLVPTGFFRAAAFVTLNLALLGLMLRGIVIHYGLRLDQVWWWFPLAFGFAPVLELLQIGQINLVSSFGIFLLFINAEALPALAGLGLTIGIVTKLTPVVFFGYLLIRRMYRAAAWGLGFLALAFGVSYFLFGWQNPLTYLDVIGNLSRFFSQGANSHALVTSLVSLGWIDLSAWPEAQNLLLVWVATFFILSGLSALATRQWEPWFVVLSLGTVVAPNHMWYHHLAFILLPLFVWIAWSRLNPAVVGWVFIGMILIQVDRWYWTQGIMPHIFVHLSLLGILAWQLKLVFQSKRHARVMIATGALGAALVLAWYFNNLLNSNSSALKARAWIEANLPAGARIASEEFTPPVDRERYVVEEFADLFSHPSTWYGEEGWEYVVTGYGTHGRFTLASVLPVSTKRYDDFIAPFTLVTRAACNSYEIRVYKTGVTLPAHRAAAQFGVYPAWLEFVGYDQATPRGVVFYWRSLVSRREKLTLTVRVLDHADREIAQATGDLFGNVYPNGTWPQGLVRVPWTVNLPASIEPGQYRIELDVDGQVAGRIPVLSPDLKPVSDKLLPGTLKIPVPLPSPVELQAASQSGVQFGDSFALESYQVGGTARAGESLDMTLYWKSIAKTNKDYTAFVHLVDSTGNVRAQVDAQPRGGAYPTSIWESGEVIRDDYSLSLPGNLALGDYTIELGAYEFPSLARLSISDPNGKVLGDHLVLTSVKVQ